MEAWIQWMLRPGAGAPKATVWIRLMAVWVFFWEGVIKFVFLSLPRDAAAEWAGAQRRTLLYARLLPPDARAPRPIGDAARYTP